MWIWIVIQKMYLFTRDILYSTKTITLLFIVQSLEHFNPSDNWIKIIQIAIQIECLHGTKFLNPDNNLDRDLDNFAQCKRGNSVTSRHAYPRFGTALLPVLYWQTPVPSDRRPSSVPDPAGSVDPEASPSRTRTRTVASGDSTRLSAGTTVKGQRRDACSMNALLLIIILTAMKKNIY